MNISRCKKILKKYHLATKKIFLVPFESILSALPSSIIAILFSVNTIHIPVYYISISQSYLASNQLNFIQILSTSKIFSKEEAIVLPFRQICHADWPIRSRGTEFRHSNFYWQTGAHAYRLGQLGKDLDFDPIYLYCHWQLSSESQIIERATS